MFTRRHKVHADTICFGLALVKLAAAPCLDDRKGKVGPRAVLIVVCSVRN